jgi:hypothetical protein
MYGMLDLDGARLLTKNGRMLKRGRADGLSATDLPRKGLRMIGSRVATVLI